MCAGALSGIFSNNRQFPRKVKMLDNELCEEMEEYEMDFLGQDGRIYIRFFQFKSKLNEFGVIISELFHLKVEMSEQ